MTDKTSFLKTLRKRPGPGDFQAVIRSTPICAVATGLNSIAFTVSTINEENSTFLLNWLCACLLLCIYLFTKTRSVKDVEFTYVTPRMIRRLSIFCGMMAAPIGGLALYFIGSGGATNLLITTVLCSGMCAGGAFMLYRTLIPAITYCGTILVCFVGALFISGYSDAITVSFYSVVYGLLLAYLSFLIGETARERDRSVEELSNAITELEVAKEQNFRLANLDTVTGLKNRKAVTETLQAAIDEYEKDGRPFSLFVLDLDLFKNINDTFGHVVGDRLLSVIGDRLTNFFKDRAHVGRMGGDEFAVVVPGLSDPSEISQITNKLIDCLRQPADLAGKTTYPSSSVGVAVCPDHGKDPVALMLAADVALNRTKEVKRGSALIFDDELRAEILRSDEIEMAMRKALRNNALEMFYQPKVRIACKTPIGAEALVRWNDPEMGFVPPSVFLPVAAERGLMPELSKYISHAVGTDIVNWRTKGLNFGKIALNIHPIDLKHPEIIFANIEQLAAQGITSEDLILEVTEGCFVGRGSEAALWLFDTLSERGYEISFDDFGTGHASLSHLKGLPVSELKIDKSFVSGVVTNKDDKAIISATVEVAKGIGIRAIAEGIEEQEQSDALIEMGVEFGQGFLWAKPMPSAAFEEYLNLQTITQIKHDASSLKTSTA